MRTLFALGLLASMPCLGFTNLGNNVLRSDGTLADTQAAINAAADGYTVQIPAGSFTWSSGVTVEGKGIRIEGAGSGRIVGRSTSSVSIGSGAKTFTTQAGLSLSIGQAVRVMHTANGMANWMRGSVLSYSGTTLQVSVTSSGGSGTRAFWVIATDPLTTITHNAGGRTLFDLLEDTTHTVRLTGVKMVEGTGSGLHVSLNRVEGGRPVLVHDCWFSTQNSMLRALEISNNRGVIYQCSFDSSLWSGGGTGNGNNVQAIGIKWPAGLGTWATPSTMGAADSTGTGNVYIEDCDFHGIYLMAFDLDDNSRAVFRYCLFNNSAGGCHGQDTSPYGVRHYEVYNCTFLFDRDGLDTYNLANGYFYLRGGTGAFTGNTFTDIQSQEWGDKSEFVMTVQHIRRDAGNPSCWDSGPPAPRQVGYGYVTGNGRTGSGGYQGDLEPIYIWGNTGAAVVDLVDYQPDECGNNQTVANYVRLGTEYRVGSARPNYTPYAYPHPLRGGTVPDVAPTITANPQALTRTVGQSATFDVSASGTAPLAYQWQRNQVNITGANAASYTIASVQLADAASYRCVVTNPQGSATSAAAALTVNPATQAPTITAQPQSLVITAGQSATFTVAATGTAPLAYQWQKNLANISGASAASYTIADAETGDAGSYRCVVSNASGSANSAAATLTVNPPAQIPPTITANPQSLVVAAGQSATFTVAATGTAPLAYRWQKNLANITGATAASYTIAAAQTGDAGSYRCVVSNAYGSANSAAASLTVNAAGGTSRYVDATAGNDANAGTAASPWRRCPGMVGWSGSATLLAGDQVYFDRSDVWDIGANGGGPGLDLKGGVHYIGDEWDPEGVGTGRAQLRATGRHEAGVVRFWEDHATLPTWLEGFEINGNGQRANLIDLNHAFGRVGLTDAVKRIEDCLAHGNAGNGSEGDYKYGIIVSDHSPDASAWVANVEILNTVVFNTARDGICLYPGDSGMISNVVVRGCEVYDTGHDPSYAEGHGIGLKGNVKNSVVEFCRVHDVDSSAVFISGPEGGAGLGPSGCAIRYSILQTVDDNGVIRFYGPGSKSCDVYGNIVLENEAMGGLSFSGCSGTIAVNVYNNTFFDAFVEIGNPSATGTINFRNNLIYERDDVCLSDGGQDVDGHGDNVYHRIGGGTLVSAGSSYTASSLSTWEPTALSADPLLKNPADLPDGFVGTYGVDRAPNRDGLSLQSSSPALDAGADLGAVFGGSINSRVRPGGAAWDIGAYEGTGVVGPAPARNLRIVAD